MLLYIAIKIVNFWFSVDMALYRLLNILLLSIHVVYIRIFPFNQLNFLFNGLTYSVLKITAIFGLIPAILFVFFIYNVDLFVFIPTFSSFFLMKVSFLEKIYVLTYHIF